MPEYSYILYVNPVIGALPSRQLPAELETFRSLCWEQSATVRWRYADPTNIAASLNGNILLVLVDCSAKGIDVKRACQVVRQVSRSPIMLIDPGRLRPQVLEGFKTIAERATFIQRDELTKPETILEKLQFLEVALPQLWVVLDYEQNDLVMREVVQWVGERRLANDIQKFFPEAQQIQLRPVAGGWSGAKLCRILVEGQNYFLKFFEDSGKCKCEYQRHHEAMKWLGLAKADVPIHLVPDIGVDADSQLRAFPQRQPVAYPVCYVSASSQDCQRETLKALYRTKDRDFLEKVFRRLIKVLQTGQTGRPRPEFEPPWGFGRAGNCFELTSKIKAKIIGTLAELDMYGSAMCSHDAQEWSNRCQVLELFLFHLPTWLTEPLHVQRGHIHGDPNPRNCLVSSTDSNDVRLIDCGDYEATGRLVSDMALIERDIKLVLMSTEEEADKFFDLDTGRLSDWCNNEQNSIGRGVRFKPGDALPALPGEFPSTNRAYRLVGLIRRRAKALCEKSDPEGIHYFAALLYWTLDVLRYDSIRPTKKLLALYSAAEILLRFQHIS